MSHTAAHVFDTAVEEVIERLDALDAMPEFDRAEVQAMLEAVWADSLGDVAAFDAAISELVKRIAVAALWPKLAELLKLADAGVERRFAALRNVTEADVLATPAVEMAEVAKRRAERIVGESHG